MYLMEFALDGMTAATFRDLANIFSDLQAALCEAGELRRDEGRSCQQADRLLRMISSDSAERLQLEGRLRSVSLISSCFSKRRLCMELCGFCRDICAQVALGKTEVTGTYVGEVIGILGSTGVELYQVPETTIQADAGPNEIDKIAA